MASAEVNVWAFNARDPRGKRAGKRTLWDRMKGKSAPVDLPVTDTAPPPQIAATRSERVRMAFRQFPMNEREENVILAVMRNPGSSSKELSSICGWNGTMWHTHLSALCKKRRDILSPVVPTDEIEDHFLGGILTEYNIDHCTFRLRPDVEPILREMGLGP